MLPRRSTRTYSLPQRSPAGAESISLALRPVAHTLGELALLLDRHDEAAAHFAQAAAIADQWNAPHWSADARTHADLALSVHVSPPQER